MVNRIPELTPRQRERIHLRVCGVYRGEKKRTRDSFDYDVILNYDDSEDSVDKGVVGVYRGGEFQHAN